MRTIKNTNSIKRTLQIFWQHMRAYPGYAVVVFSTAFIGSLYGVVAPLFYKRFFDVLADAKGVPTEMAVQGLFSVLTIIAGLLVIHWAVWRLNDFCNIFFQARIRRDLMHTAFDYLVGHSYNFFTNSFTGALVKRIARIANAFEGVADDIMYRILPLVVSIVGIMIVLFLRHPFLGVAFLTWTIIMVAFHASIARYKNKFDIIKSEKDSALTAALSDAIANEMTTKFFSGEQHEKQLIRGVTGDHEFYLVKSWRIGATVDMVQGALMVVIEVVMLAGAIWLWQHGHITVGDFALIQAYLITAMGKLWDFGKILRHLYEMFADAAEMVEILDTPYEVADPLVPEAFMVTKGKVEFRKVSFAFNQTRQVFKDLDLTIAAGEKIALIGPSGAGKTTVVKLLLRLHDVGHGGIYIDEQNIARTTQAMLRAHIAFVPQEPILFHRSLMENIRYGRRDANDAEVLEAAKQAHCHEFISELPDGYNTYVGERGIKLSGGERQRVAIARAILKNAPILVLDEATSALDSESERLIQDALQKLMKDKTVIVIAHRLSTIMKMDRIVVIQNGEIADQGTHAELLKKDGLYKKLWDIQAGGFIGE